jgi:hypothetical protein
VLQGQTVNQFYYSEILGRLRVVRVRPNIAKNWMLQHNKAPYHMAISVIEFWFHSPHTPLIWVHATLFLFPKLKIYLKWRHSGTVENIAKLQYSIKHPIRCTVNLIFIALSRRHRSTCFGHYCAHHQEPPPTAFAASGYLMIAGLDVFQSVVGLLV